MTSLSPVLALDHVHELAESPRWDDVSQTALWVDITRGQVFRGVLGIDGIQVTGRLDFPETVGAAVLEAGGGVLVAAHDRLVHVTPAGAARSTGVLLDHSRHERFNDAAVDPAGRVLVGTKAITSRQGAAALFALEANGTLTVLRDHMNLANGIGWSPDGNSIYVVDSLPGVLWLASYDVDSGRAHSWAPLAAGFDGLPDGIAVDADGRIWVAVWGGGQVVCFAPSGELLRTVQVPVPHVTAVAFVGPERDRLLITTARSEFDEPLRRQLPEAGCLYLADVAAVGLPTSRWAGTVDGPRWHPDVRVDDAAGRHAPATP